MLNFLVQSIMEERSPKVVLKTVTSNRQVLFMISLRIWNTWKWGCYKIRITKKGRWVVDILSQYCWWISDQAYIWFQFWNFGLEWHLFVRIIANEDGATVTWIFIKPDGISKDQFATWTHIHQVIQMLGHVCTGY